MFSVQSSLIMNIILAFFYLITYWKVKTYFNYFRQLWEGTLWLSPFNTVYLLILF